MRPKATTVTHWVDIVDTNDTCLCLCHPEVTFFEDKTRQRQSLSLPPTHPLLLSLFQFNDEIKGLDIEIFFYKFTMITCYIQQSTMSIVNNYFRWLQWNIPSHSAPALEGERSESSKTFPYQIRNELPSNTKFRFFLNDFILPELHSNFVL